MNRKVKNSYDMIKIDNKLFEQLNTEEFYLYCWLRYRYVAYDLNCTTASIDLMANKIQFVKDMTRNKQKIKDMLLKLQHSKIITIKHDSKIKNNTTLEIAFNNMNPVVEYTALDYKYVHIDDHQALYVIATLRRWQHAKDKTFSLSEWSNTLSVTVPTVLAIFERMEKQGLLRVDSGDYYQTDKGELRQYNNRYYLVAGQARTEDEAVVTKTVTNEMSTVDEGTTVEPEQVVPEREPLGVQKVMEPEKQTHFKMFNETYNVKEILARLRHNNKAEKVYMQEVDYVWYQHHKQYLDKKTVNLVEAKLRGMENSKSDYAQQQLAKMIDTYEKYQGQTSASKIRELARTQPVVVMRDGSFTTDIDNIAIDYEDMQKICYVYNGEFKSREFIKGQKDEMGNMCERPMTTVEKQNYIGRVVESYKQKAV